MHLSPEAQSDCQSSRNSGDGNREKEASRSHQFEADLGWLTPQLRRVLEHLGDGLSNKVIARQLGIVESTVKVYVSKLIHGFGCENRTQVALLALRIRYGLPLGDSSRED